YVDVSVYLVVHGTGFDDARPTDKAWHAPASFPVSVLLTAERRDTTIRPSHFFGAVVGGVHDDRVICDTQLIDLVKKLSYHSVMLNHAVRFKAKTSFTN